MEALKVHPAAECFRLMRDDELADLAEDIKTNGLRDAITLGKINGYDAAKVLVDGRNRLRACEVAGVKPRYETIEFENDDEVRAFVKSRSARRDLSKGERAAALALLYPGGQGKADEAGKTSAETAEVSIRRLQQARQVGRHSTELLHAVRDGVVALDEALKQVQEARKSLETNEAQLARLRAKAQDLADLVNEDRMPLNEAIAAFNQREAEQKAIEDNKRETLIRLTEAACRGLEAWTNEGFAQDVEERLQDHEFMKQLSERAKMLPASTIKQAAVNLMRLYARGD
jgi:hypothetical protein